VPALPEVFAHVPTYPAFHYLYASPLLADTKVVPPTPDIVLPTFDAFFQCYAFLGTPLTANLFLEPVQTGLSRCYTTVAIDAKPQELAIPGMSDTTLVNVDAQF
jgi:hypothetical protein